jgi:hypothetical protein
MARFHNGLFICCSKCPRCIFNVYFVHAKNECHVELVCWFCKALVSIALQHVVRHPNLGTLLFEWSFYNAYSALSDKQYVYNQLTDYDDDEHYMALRRQRKIEELRRVVLHGMKQITRIVVINTMYA